MPDGTAFAPAGHLAGAVRRIAREVAAPHADAVDRDARFPAEAVAALRGAGLLGIAVPAAIGGPGAPFRAVAAACFDLGQACANTAMVFAMHQIQVACLVRHAAATPWHRAFLARVVQDQLLLASATTEAGSGGNVRRSECAVHIDGGRASVVKAGCIISYAREADAVLATARRTPDSTAGDQVAILAERHQYSLTPVARWDTLGMRGTCSEGFDIDLQVGPDQILPDAYAEIAAQTMLPVSHILWSAVWLGIATASCDRARAAIRRRLVPGAAPPAGAARLTAALSQLQSLRAQVVEATRRYDDAEADADRLGSIPFALAINQLKVAVSAGTVQVIGDAMLATGLTGYRNDSPDSLGRHLRDAHSAPLMIGNDRIVANCTALLGGFRGDEELFA